MSALWWSHLATTYPPYILEFSGTLLTQILFYWIPCTLYLLLDIHLPAFSRAHKLQPASHQPTRAQVAQCIQLALRNQLISISLQLVNLLATRDVPADEQRLSFSPSLPTLHEFARDFAVLVVVREVWFYYVHRALHTRLLYGRVHALHHRFVAPVAFASQFAHPVEHVVANVMPSALPPKMIRTHVVTSWAFLGWILLETCTAHSGYDFFAGSSKMHDLHHERSVVNYGGLGWMDWLHGTRDRGVGTGKPKEIDASQSITVSPIDPATCKALRLE
jgi:sterol desaturase/sphingolipid hydroxylase (fatty acid hydroxylase superfamily)